MRRIHVFWAAVAVVALGLVLESGASAQDPPPDTTAPVITVPASPVTVEATSSVGAVVSYAVSATDDVDGPVPVSCTPDSGSAFTIGSTTVTCSAQDAATNSSNADFQVAVVDTQAPTLTVPGPISAPATGAAGAVVTFTASASDAVAGAPDVTCDPASGSTFPIGSTTVTCTAQDAAGNTGTGSFQVTVADTSAPTVTVPSPITTPSTSASGAVVTFSASAMDAIDGARTVTCSPASGSMFPIGATTVACSAQDVAGNIGSANFQVTVTDAQPPTVTVPADITTPATSAEGAVVTFTASASDTVDGPRPVACAPAAGSTFPVGDTTVTCSAQDLAGNTGTAAFEVTVADTQSPTVTVPGPLSAVATSAAGAVVTFTASATDVVDGARPVTCSPASGSTFPIGNRTVTCTASDTHGNSGSSSFIVTVTDAAPTIAVPPTQTVEATGPNGASVKYAPPPTASDTVDGPLIVSCSRASGAAFPLGSTTVTCTAVDSAGSSVAGSFIVSVVDTTPPVVTAPPDATFVGDGGLPRSTPLLAAYLARGRAGDLVDPAPVLYVEAPDVFRTGENLVRYIAVDSSGNRGEDSTIITVVPPPAPGQPRPPAPPADDPPPGNVTALRARPGNRLIRLSWTAPRDADVVRYAAFRSERSGPQVQVYGGAARSFTDRGLVNGVEYRYVVVAYDRGGNRSVGVAVLGTPRLPMLLAPREGARLARATTFSWRRVAGARYYNFQLFRAAGAQRFVKVLSAWPVTNRFTVGLSWRFAGRKQRLVPGTYRWFVWPGFGARADARYGDVLGERTFVVTRRR
jgi:hypothetical protein